MTETEIAIDPIRQGQAKEYARIRRRIMLLELVIGGIYSFSWLVLGLSVEVKQNLLLITDNEWGLVALFMFIFGGLYYLITLPISFFSGYVLPHRYQLSTQNIRGWVIDQLTGLGIGILFGGIRIEIIYALMRSSPDWWWLWVALTLLLFNVILANLAPIVLFPIFYKFVPLGDDHAELVDLLMNLASRAKTFVRGVYKFDMSSRTKAANAGLAGLGNTRRIILGDTLIDEFTPDEIETVLAHELGHHVHKDIPLSILVDSSITVIGLLIASIALNWGSQVLEFSGIADIAGLPLFILVMGAYGLISMPIGNLFSRRREYLADEFAIRITGKAGAYASALVRLANQNLAEIDPEPWVEFLLYSHPALGKRIAFAQEVSKNEIR